MSVEVKRQPRRPDMTYIPALLVEHFESAGQQVGLRKHSPDVLGMDYAIGWRPVEVDALPEESQQVLKASFEVKNGHAFRGDTVLAIRSFEARDEQRELMEELRRSQDDDEYWIESIESQMQDLVRQTGRGTGRSLLVGNVPRLDEHVLAGAKLAPLVERELRRGRGRPPR